MNDAATARNATLDSLTEGTEVALHIYNKSKPYICTVRSFHGKNRYMIGVQGKRSNRHLIRNIHGRDVYLMSNSRTIGVVERVEVL